MPTPESSGIGSRPRVLVLGNVRREGLDVLETFADVIVLPEPAAKADIVAAIGDADAVLHKIGKIDAEVIESQSRLRLVARHGVGLDDLDIDSLASAGVAVSTTAGANANAVADATVGLALASIRKFSQAETMVRRDRLWRREALTGRELASMTVGIVGFGRIGRLVANRFRAFGASILIHDAFVTPLPEDGFKSVSLETLLKSADIVSLHCPLTPETHHMIDADRLTLMQKHAVVINTARGGLIDQRALATAVRSGQIAGAALDVFDREPPDFDDPVFSTDGIMTTPHIAAMTHEAQVAMAVSAATEIRRVLIDGEEPTNNVAIR